MKICVVAQRVPYPPNKGEKLRTFHQIERMVELGYSVEVVTFSEETSDNINASSLKDKLGITVTIFPLAGKLSRYLSALLKNQPISVGAFYQTDAAKYLDMVLKQNACDVMFLSASSLAGYVLSSPSVNQSQCKVMIDFMDVDSDKWLQYASNANWPMCAIYQREAKGIRELERKANEQFEKTFLIAQEEVALFKRDVCNANPVTVLGNGLDFSLFYPAENTEKKEADGHFLFTGVMDYKPNVDAVLWFVQNCWPGIKKHLPTAVFTVGGMNPLPEINALNGVDGVRVTGFVDDMLPFFHEATAFVAPFRLARGVQNKVLQAAACDLTIVTTPMGAEGIQFASQQTMFIESSAEAFTAACIECVTNTELAQSKANQALQAIRDDYSWKQQLLPLEHALDKLAKKAEGASL